MNYFHAMIEYHETPERFKPLMVFNPKTGLYLVTWFFSKAYIATQGMEVIHG